LSGNAPAQLIFFTASIVIAVGLVAVFTAVVVDLSSAMDDRSGAITDELTGRIALVDDPSTVQYDDTLGTLVLLVKNVGSRTLLLEDPSTGQVLVNLIVFVDGEQYTEGSITVGILRGGSYWYAGDTISLTLSGITLDPGVDHTTTVFIERMDDSLTFQVEVDDTDSPVTQVNPSNYQSQTQADTGAGAARIFASAVDNVDVSLDESVVYFRKVGDITFSEIPFKGKVIDNGAGKRDTLYADIPVDPNDDTDIEYYVEFRDSSGNTVTDNNLGSYYPITVDDVIAPRPTLIPPTTGSVTSDASYYYVNATVRDNIDVQSGIFHYRWVATSRRSGDGPFDVGPMAQDDGTRSRQATFYNVTMVKVDNPPGQDDLFYVDLLWHFLNIIRYEDHDLEYYIEFVDAAGNAVYVPERPNNSTVIVNTVSIDDNQLPTYTPGDGTEDILGGTVTTYSQDDTFPEDNFQIDVSFQDNVDIAKATLYYRKAGFSQVYSHLMQKTFDGAAYQVIPADRLDSFSASFHGPFDGSPTGLVMNDMDTSDGVDWEYWVVAEDNKGQKVTSGTSSNPWTIEFRDNDPPVQTVTPGSFTIGTGDTFLIETQAIDNIDVVQADLFVRQFGGGAYTQYVMTRTIERGPGLADVFSVSDSDISGIVDTTVNGVYEYYLEIRDAIGLTASGPSSGLPGTITIIDDDSPVSQVTSTRGFTIYTSATPNFNIVLQVLDNEVIDSADLYVRKGTGAWQSVPGISPDGPAVAGVTTFTIGNNAIPAMATQATWSDAVDWSWYAVIHDQAAGAPNNNVSHGSAISPFPITVVDDTNPALSPDGGNPSVPITTGDTFTLGIDVTENVDAVSGMLFFRATGAPFYTAHLMDKTVNGTFGGVDSFSLSSNRLGVDTTNDQNDYQYYFIAADAEGNTNLWGAPGSPLTITVQDDDIPAILASTTSFSIGTGNAFSLYVNATDNIDVNDVELTWGGTQYSLAPTYKVLDAAPGSVDRYRISSANLDVLTGGALTAYLAGQDDSDIVFGFEAFDSDGNSFPVGPYTMTVLDDDLPVFQGGTAVNFAMDTDQGVVFTAVIRDNIDVSTANLHLKKDGAGSFSSLVGVKDVDGGAGANDQFTWTFLGGNDPDFNVRDASDWSFYITASDGVTGTVTWGNPTTPYRITVTDNIDPAVNDIGGDMTVGTGDTFTVYVDYIDNVDVSSAEIFYKASAAPTWSSKPMSKVINGGAGAVDRYEISNETLVIGTVNFDTDFRYFIVGYDAQGNFINTTTSNGDQPYWINVTDDDPPTLETGTGKVTAAIGDLTEFTITVEVRDNIDVVSAVMEMTSTLDGSVFFYDMTASKVDGPRGGIDTFSVDDDDIMDTTNGTDYYYRIFFNDTLTPAVPDDTFTYGPFLIEITDNSGPILNASRPNTENVTATTGDNFDIWINFTDNDDVSRAEIYYRKLDGSWKGPYNMEKTVDAPSGVTDVFHITYDPVTFPYLSGIGNATTSMNTTDGIRWDYYIMAWDDSGKYLYYGDPSAPYHINLTDNDSPVVEEAYSTSWDVNATTGETFAIIVSARDNVDVSQVELFYRKEMVEAPGWTAWSSKMMNKITPRGPGLVDNFRLTNVELGFDTTNDFRDFEWYAMASDAAGNPDAEWDHPGTGSDHNVIVLDNDLPIYVSSTGNMTRNTGAGWTWYFNVTDNIDVGANGVTLYWRMVGNGTWPHSAFMVRDTNGTYGVVDRFSIDNDHGDIQIDTTTDASDYEYYFSAVDAAGNTLEWPTGGAASSFLWTIQVVDGTAPTIEPGSTEDFAVNTEDSFTITTNVADNDDVASATLYVKKVGGAYQTGIPMVKTLDGPNPGDTDTFELTYAQIDAALPGFNMSDAVDWKFYVRATDGDNIADHGSAGTPWTITITDDTPPFARSSMGDFGTTTGESFSIQTSFVDNVDITTAELWWKDQSDTVWTGPVAMSRTIAGAPGEADEFRLTKTALGISTTNSLDEIYYYWFMDDGVGLSVNSSTPAFASIYTITVTDNDAPVFVNGTGNRSAMTSSEFWFAMNATDNIEITTYDLYYRQVGNGTYDSVEFTKVGGGAGVTAAFHRSSTVLGIDTSTDSTNWQYYAVIQDAAGNTYNYGSSGSPYIVNIIDEEAPVTDGGSGNVVITSGEDFTLNATFVDNVDVTGATLYIKRTGEPYQTVAPTEADNPGGREDFVATYAADISAAVLTTDATDLQYYFEATDGTNTVQYGSPGSPYSVTVTDNDQPSLDSSIDDFDATSGEAFTIYANFTDNVDVTTVNIWYRQVGGGGYTGPVTMQKTSNGPAGGVDRFSITSNALSIDTSNDVTNYEYYIQATDSITAAIDHGLDVSPWTVTVTDNDDPYSPSGSGNFTRYTGDAFTFIFQAKDNLDIVDAYFYYKKGTGGWNGPNETTSGVEKFSDGGVDDWDKFRITSATLALDTTYDSDDYQYYAVFYDEEGNSVNYGDMGNPWRLTIGDNDPPASTGGSGDIGGQTSGDNFDIQASFSDNVDITSATIFVRKAGESYQAGVPMPTKNPDNSAALDGIGEDTFTVSYTEIIVALSGVNFTSNDAKDWEYYVLATDGYSTVNYGNATVPYTVTISDNDEVVNTWSKGDFGFTTGSVFTIENRWSDNVDVPEDGVQVWFEGSDNPGVWIGPFDASKTRDLAAGHSDIFKITSLGLGLDTNNNLTAYNYYSCAEDDAANGQVCDGTQMSPYTISVIDDDDPIVNVVNSSTNVVSTTDDEWTVTFNISDNIDVQTVTIYLQNTSAGGWSAGNVITKSLDSSPGAMDRFTTNYTTLKGLGVIDTSNGISWAYYLTVADAAGNSVDWPPGGAGGPASITLADNDDPIFDSASGAFTTTSDDAFTIYFNASDNKDVSNNVTIYLMKEGAGWDGGTQPMTKVDDEPAGEVDEFEITYAGLPMDTTDAVDWFYRITIWDAAGNTIDYDNGGGGFRITVDDNDAPVRNPDTPNNVDATTGDTFTIYYNTTDNVDATEAVAFVRKTGGGGWSAGTVMTEIVDDPMSAETFTVTYEQLGIDTNDGVDWEYYIIVNDSVGNSFTDNAGGSFYPITLTDNDDPEWDSSTGNTASTTNDTFTLYFNGTDNVNVNTVTVWMQKGGSGPWVSAAMTPQTAGGAGVVREYTATLFTLGISTTDDTDWEFYYVVADADGNSYTHNNTGSGYSLAVTDNDDPITFLGSTPTTYNVDTDEAFTIYYNVSDNVNVIAAKITVRKTLSGVWGVAVGMTQNDNNPMGVEAFSIASGALGIDTSDGQPWYFKINATDAEGNTLVWDGAGNGYLISPNDIEPPTRVDSMTPRNYYTGDDFAFWFKAADNVDPTAVTLYYKQDTASWSTYSLPDGGGNDTFAADASTVGISLTNGYNVCYYFVARDAAANTLTYPTGGATNYQCNGFIDDDDPINNNGTSTGAISETSDDDFTIDAAFRDNVNVSTATIYFQKAAEGWDGGSPMSKVSNGSEGGIDLFRVTYNGLGTGVIDTDDSVDWYYRVTATDENGNTVTYDNGGGGYLIHVVDNDDPTRTDSTGAMGATTGEDFTFWITADDNVDPTSAKVYYRYGALGWQNFDLVEDDDNFSSGAIAAGVDTTAGFDVRYYYTVTDDEGNTLTYPGGAPTTFLTVTVTDNDDPTTDLGPTTDILAVTTDDDFTITYGGEDNVDIDFVTIYFKKGAGGWDGGTLMNAGVNASQGGTDLFSVTYDDLGHGVIDTTDATDWKFYFVATDTNGNTETFDNTGAGWSITVTDNDDPTRVTDSGNMATDTDAEISFWITTADNVDPTGAILHYRVGAGSWDTSAMSESADNFSVTKTDIGLDTDDGQTVSYYFTVEDDEANELTYPTNAPTTYYSVTFTDAEDPVAHSGSGPITADSDGAFTLYANFTDNMDVSNAIIYVQKDGGGWSGGQAMVKALNEGAGGTDRFTITYAQLGIDTTDAVDWYYRVTATDGGGNTDDYDNGGGGFLITILDALDPNAPTFATSSFAADTGDDWTITYTGSDNVDLTAVGFWLQKAAGGYTEYAMTEGPDDTFTISKDGMGLNTSEVVLWDYYFVAADDAGNERTTDRNDQIILTDSQAPYGHTGAGAMAKGTGEAWTFTYQARDNVDVSGATLYYRKVGGGGYSQSAMTKDTNGAAFGLDIFSKTSGSLGIDTSLDATNWEYYVVSTDSEGNTITYPNAGAGSPFIVTVTDDDIPTEDGDSIGEFSTTNGTAFTITFNVTDNIDVTLATIYWRNETSGYSGGDVMAKGDGVAGSSDRFTITSGALGIDTTGDSADLFYYIVFTDGVTGDQNYGDGGTPKRITIDP